MKRVSSSSHFFSKQPHQSGPTERRSSGMKPSCKMAGELGHTRKSPAPGAIRHGSTLTRLPVSWPVACHAANDAFTRVKFSSRPG